VPTLRGCGSYMFNALHTELLWRNAVSAIPLAILVAATCRWLPCRPATRHALWMMVLLWMVLPPVLPSLDITHGAGDSAAVTPTSPNELPSADGPQPREAQHEVVAKRFTSTVRADRHAPPNLLGELRTGSPKLMERAPRAKTGYLALRHGGLPAESSTPDSTDRPRTEENVGGATIAESKLVSRATRRPIAPNPDFPRAASPELKRPSAPMRKAPAPEADHATKTAGSSKQRETGVAATTPPPGVVVASRDASPFRAWAAALIAVRDAVGSVPPFPAHLWLFGLITLVLVKAGAILRFCSALGNAAPAPESVVSLVTEVARKMGLNRPPHAFMVDRQVSPMVWCGWRPRLLLPVELWAQFDDAGRRAVLCHELAHLKRRDHWVSWVSASIGGIYWWHPVVWWVRRRLHAEAELCCDAWVTWLLPRDRRAYAEALLTTKRYVSEQRFHAPAMGIGVTTGRAGLFSRRIRMVMTRNLRPRLSVSGLLLASTLAMVGWAAAPARSCPKDQEASKVKGVAIAGAAEARCGGCDKSSPCKLCASLCKGVNCASAATCTKSCDGKPCKTCERSRCAQSTGFTSASTFERYMAGRGQGDPAVGYVLAGSGGDEQLEERLARLEERLERLAERLGNPDEGRMDPGPRRAPRVERAPRAPRGLRAPRMGRKPLDTPDFIGKGEAIVRAYHVSSGKLAALVELMARQDVPILIRPRDDAIEVHGTDAQHAAFADFVNLIDAQEEVVEYHVPPGRLEALTQLMSRADVPVLISPGDDRIKVHGTALELDIFRRFVDIIAPDAHFHSSARPNDWEPAKPGFTDDDGPDVTFIERKVKREEKSQKNRAKTMKKREQRAGGSGHEIQIERAAEVLGRERIAQLLDRLASTLDDARVGEIIQKVASVATERDAVRCEGHRREIEADAAEIEEMALVAQQRAREHEGHARQLEREARQMDLAAQQIELEVERMASAAESVEAEQRAALLAEAETLAAEARAMQSGIQTLEGEADSAEGTVDSLEEQAEAYAETADALRETVQALIEWATAQAGEGQQP